MIQAFKSIFKETGGKYPATFRSDFGSEYKNRLVKQYFSEHNIFHYFTSGQNKAYFAERVIRSLRLLLSRYLRQKNSQEWVQVLPKLTANYNASYHSSILMAPNDVTEKNAGQVWANLTLIPIMRRRQQKIKEETKTVKREKKEKKRVTPYKVDIGDYVRISYTKRAFEKTFDQKFSGEIFVVAKRYRRLLRPVYRLQDLKHEHLSGFFHNHEIQKIRVPKNPTFVIDKILQTKKGGSKKMYKVSWRFYPKKFDSWVEASTVKHLLKKIKKSNVS
jgi:hypothetical protein